MLAVLILALAVLTVLSLIRRQAWPFELLSHFRPHAILAGSILSFAGIAVGDLVMATAGFGLGLVNRLLLPGPRWLEPAAALAAQPGITVVWANVWRKRSALERTLQWAEARHADLILIGEFPDGDAGDPSFASAYPHRLDGVPDGMPPLFGSRVVALSKLPLIEPRVIPAPGAHVRPFLAFAVELPGGRRLNIYPVHPNAPMTAQLQQERDAMVDKLATIAGAPFLIAGDFNATPWCRVYPKIPGQRVGSPGQTWLTRIPFLGLAIDHIKVSEGILPSSYEVGPFLGSDHRALLTRVHFVDTRA